MHQVVTTGVERTSFSLFYYPSFDAALPVEADTSGHVPTGELQVSSRRIFGRPVTAEEGRRLTSGGIIVIAVDPHGCAPFLDKRIVQNPRPSPVAHFPQRLCLETKNARCDDCHA